MNPSVIGTLDVSIEHSGDGIHWKQKNAVSEVSVRGFTAGQNVNVVGQETFATRPSHEYVRLSITMTSNSFGAAWGALTIQATGQRRTSRLRAPRTPAAARLSQPVRRHLPPAVAAELEAFRLRAGLSAETLGEARRLWEATDVAGHDERRAKDVHFVLSLRARQELATFHRELAKLRPAAVAHLRHAVGVAAMEELLTPGWAFE